MNIKKINKWVLIYISIFSIIIFILLNFICKTSYIFSNILFILFLFFLSFEIALILNIPITYIIFNHIERKKIKDEEKKSKFDIETMTYFRDKIPGTIPGIIGYIINGENNYKNDIMAALFSLKIRNYITIENNNVGILDKKIDKLSENEKYIIYNSKFIFSAKEFKKRWKNLIIEDCISKNLLIKREKTFLPNFQKITGALIILMLISAVVSLIFNQLFEIILYIYLIALLSSIIMISIQLIEDITYKNNNYIKTKDGYELYIKLIGLRKFLKDFSTIDQRKKEEILLWEDYMIYAIMFNEKEILNKDILKQYEEMEYLEKIIIK